MMYGVPEYSTRIPNMQVMDFAELRDRILMQPEGEQNLVMWATCLRQNDPGEKILRNIPPILVYVTLISEPNPFAHINGQPAVKYHLHAVDNAKRNKEIKIYTNNHGDLILCDMQEEATRYYNRVIDVYIKSTRDALKSRTQYLEDKISSLHGFRIAGSIVEEVISPTCGT